MLASCYQIARLNVTEDRNLDSHSPENINLKICNIIFLTFGLQSKFYRSLLYVRGNKRPSFPKIT